MKLRVDLQLDLEVPDGMDPMTAARTFFLYHGKFAAETVLRHIRIISAERIEPWEGLGGGWNERPYDDPDES